MTNQAKQIAPVLFFGALLPEGKQSPEQLNAAGVHALQKDFRPRPIVEQPAAEVEPIPPAEAEEEAGTPGKPGSDPKEETGNPTPLVQQLL